MEYISVKEWAELHGVSERTARNYCAQGKIDGALLVGKTWNVPVEAGLPKRKSKKNSSPLLSALREQKEGRVKGGIYHRVQIDLTYNSNHIEGSKLTHDQTRYIFETNTIGVTDTAVNVDDIVETTNHFRAIDYLSLIHIYSCFSEHRCLYKRTIRNANCLPLSFRILFFIFYVISFSD